ncbi:MAG: proprotein convertase P-domain-containing protein, partial [Bacteroidales bacterium]|nr:proprotein convertase P-domain-containing protein [Bacteroidales bacterium]
MMRKIRAGGGKMCRPFLLTVLLLFVLLGQAVAMHSHTIDSGSAAVPVPLPPPPTTLNITTFICGDTAFVFNGKYYTQTGSFLDTIRDTHGNDSVYVAINVRKATIGGASAICIGAEDTLYAYPAAAHYLWSTGDTTPKIKVDSAGVYRVTIVDENGCSSSALHLIKVPYNPILSVDTPIMCAGLSYPVTVGYSPESSIWLGSIPSTLGVSDTTFMPDGIDCGNGCSYVSTLHFSGFPSYTSIISTEDILYLKLSIEHEWIGDLWIKLTCPNGQSTSILKKHPNTSGTSSPCLDGIPSSEWGWDDNDSHQPRYRFGIPYFDGNHQNDSVLCDTESNPMCECWDYCWSETVDQGYIYSSTGHVYSAANTTTATVPNDSYHSMQQLFCAATNTTNMSNVFHPDGSFHDLIGCPVNGDWEIEVMDGWHENNGYICGWELAMNRDLLY